MTPDEQKRVELRGYSKGYTAGKKRKQRDISNENLVRKRNVFWQRAFLAALPVAFTAQGWNRCGVEIKTLPDRVLLAKDIADEALKRANHYL